MSVATNETPSDLSSVKTKFNSIFERLTKNTISDSSFEDSQSFKELGLKSIQSFELISQINSTFNLNLSPLNIFEYSTYGDFIGFLYEKINGSKKSPPLYSNKLLIDDQLLIDDLDIFTKEIDNLSIPQSREREDRGGVLITGGTGFLGAFIIEHYLNSSDKDIFCLIRADNVVQGRERLFKNLNKYGVDNSGAFCRINVIIGDLKKPNFGMDNIEYIDLSKRVTNVAHAAAEIDHLGGYSSLRRSNVIGTMEIIKFSCTSRIKDISFASTIMVGVKNRDDGELYFDGRECFFDTASDISTGYGRSKWVCEQLLKEYQQRTNSILCVHRIGEITAHTSTGASRQDDIFHNMINCFLELGSLPPLRGLMVNVVPVDFTAKVMALTINKDQSGAHLYNLCNSNPIPLATYMSYWIGNNLPIANSIQEWIDKANDIISKSKKKYLEGLPLFIGSNEDDWKFPEYFNSFMADQGNFLLALQAADLTLPVVDDAFVNKHKTYLRLQK